MSEYSIYLIAPLVEGTLSMPVKVGLSIDVNRRAREIQTHHPHSIVVVGLWTYPCFAQARRAEKVLHGTFGLSRLRGEWFGLPAGYAFAMMDRYFNSENIFNRIA